MLVDFNLFQFLARAFTMLQEFFNLSTPVGYYLVISILGLFLGWRLYIILQKIHKNQHEMQEQHANLKNQHNQALQDYTSLNKNYITLQREHHRLKQQLEQIHKTEKPSLPTQEATATLHIYRYRKTREQGIAIQNIGATIAKNLALTIDQQERMQQMDKVMLAGLELMPEEIIYYPMSISPNAKRPTLLKLSYTRANNDKDNEKVSTSYKW